MSSSVLSISPVEKFSWAGRLPGDPAVAQTAIARALASPGPSLLRNLPEGDADTEIMLRAAADLGCHVERDGTTLRLTPPAGGLREPSAPIDLGNAGYPLRLLIGLLAAQPFRSRLIPGHPLNKRNIERVLEPLRTIGAELTSSDRGTPPVNIFPGHIVGGRVDLPIPNAWVKASLLAAAAAAGVELTVTEPLPSRDYAERILGADREPADRYLTRTHPRTPAPLDWTLPSDSVLADHLTAIALLGHGSAVTIEDRVLTPIDTRLLGMLESTADALELHAGSAETPLPTGRLQTAWTLLNEQIELDARTMPGIEAELPLLAVLVGCGGGSLKVVGAMNMRQQLCDRISAIVDNLAFFGIDTEEYDDGFRVTSTGKVTGGAELSGYDDPVIAAAMIVLSAAADAPSLLFDVPEDSRIASLVALLGAHVRPLAPEELEG